MIRRLIWLTVGAVIGWVWGVLSLRSLRRKARRAMDPAVVVELAADKGEELGRRVSYAVRVGREDARRTETRLKQRFAPAAVAARR